MNRSRWIKRSIILLLLAALITGGVIVGTNAELRHRGQHLWHHAMEWAGLADTPPSAEEVFWCPMHPQIKRNRPDTCPICNMALVPLEEGARADGYDGLILTARHVQQAGVVTEPVLRRELYREVDTTGRIVIDERRLAKITTWVFGRSRLDELHVNFTGERVEKGQVIGELFSPQLITTQDELLSALQSRSPTLGDQLVEAAKRKLRYQGLSNRQIDSVVESRKVMERIPIDTPIGGTVIRRHVAEGQYVQEGDPLFEIADLSKLWLYADIYEDELPLISVGQAVELTVRSMPGEVFAGQVAFIDPIVQPNSRTVRVRLDINNTDGRLKPDMYARVRFTSDQPAMLAVPSEAVLWSGRRTVVIVREGEGKFRPVEVKLGQKWLYPVMPDVDGERSLGFGAGARQYQQVLSGLSLGDEVVIAGAFLLGAESQFQSVLTKLLPPQSVTATLTDLLGEELTDRVMKALCAYHELSAALANDDMTVSAQAASRLSEAVGDLAASASKSDHPDLAEAAVRVRQAAQALAAADASDSKATRSAFGGVSRAMITMLRDHGGRTLLGEDLFVFECPMADDFGFKLWLQPGQDMRNPYMGQRMLKCGKKLETLQP